MNFDELEMTDLKSDRQKPECHGFAGWLHTPMLALGLLIGAALPLASALGSTDLLIMYWDKHDPGEGGTLSGFDAPAWLEVPSEACGFLVEKPGDVPDSAWSFHEPHGQIVDYQDIPLSSDARGELQGPIQAVGPVHACHDQGGYNFQIPAKHHPVYHPGPEPIAGAGRLVVQINQNLAVTWLDHAFNPIDLPGGIGKDPEKPKLPPEFIGKTPSVLLCPLDKSLDQYQCLPQPKAAQMPAAAERLQAPSVRQLAQTRQTATRAAATRTAMPDLVLATLQAPATGQGAADQAIECPTSLMIRGTIYRDPDFEPDPSAYPDHQFNPPVVEYRFYFAPEHVASVRFSVALTQEETEISHSVPIPLPIPDPDPPPGGIDQPTDRLGARMPPHPDDRVPPGRTGVQVPDPRIVGHPVPEGVYQGSVQMQLLNITDAAGKPVTIRSPWSAYTIRCANGEEPPPDDRPVLTTPIPVPPPQPPTGLAAPKPAETDREITCLRGTIEDGRCVCPRGMRAVPTANPDVFQCLPARGRQP